MAKTYSQLQKAIKDLEKQAEVLRKKEVSGVIARMKVAITEYGLTAADLGLDGARQKGRSLRGRASSAYAGKTSKSKAASKPMYRDAAGNTWTGHGRRPAWFVKALESGTSKEALLA